MPEITANPVTRYADSKGKLHDKQADQMEADLVSYALQFIREKMQASQPEGQRYNTDTEQEKGILIFVARLIEQKIELSEFMGFVLETQKVNRQIDALRECAS